MSSSASDVVLSQNITLLTNAIQALNTNMFQTSGGRPGILGGGGAAGGGRPGQGINSTGDPHKDALNLTKSNNDLSKSLRQNADTMKYLVKEQAQNIKNANQFTQTASRYFETFLTKFSAKQLNNEIPKKITTLFTDALEKDLMGPMKNVSDVLKLNTRLQTENLEASIEVIRQHHEEGLALKETEAKLEKLGWGFDSVNRIVKEYSGDVEKAKTAVANMAAKMAKVAVADEQHTIATGKVLDELKKFAAVVGAVGAIYLDSAQAAAKFGTTFEHPLLAAAKGAAAGLSPQDLAQLQHEQSQAIYSSSKTVQGAMGDFQTTLVKGAWSLLQFTDSLADGAKLTASFIGNFRALSDNTDMQNGYMNQQQKLFEDLNRTFSVTTEQFSQLNEQLTNNQSVQTMMYKLNRDQRVANFQNLQQTYSQLRADGLLHDQALKVVDTLAELAGGKTQTRVEQASKFRVAMGALGLGAEGQAAFNEILKGQAGNWSIIRQAATAGQRELTRREGAAAATNQTNNIVGTGYWADIVRSTSEEFLGANSALSPLAISQGRQQGAGKSAELKSRDYLGNKLGNDFTTAITGIRGIREVAQSGFKDVVKAIWLAATVQGGVSMFSGGLKKFAGKFATGGESALAGVEGGAGGIGKFGKFGLKYGKFLGPAGAIGGGLAAGLATGDWGGAAGGAAGGWAGAEGGALAGAAIGSVVPIIGTAIGAVLGGLIGGAAGSWGGGKIGSWLGGNSSSPKEMAQQAQDQAGQQETLIDQLKQQQEAYAASGDQTDADKLGDKIKEMGNQLEVLQKKLEKDSPLGKIMTAMHLEIKRGNDVAQAQRDDQHKATKQIIEKKDTFSLPANK